MSICTSRMIGECEAMSTIFSLSLKEDDCIQPSSLPFPERRWGHVHLHLPHDCLPFPS